MQSLTKTYIVPGFALFSMFFGAGNIAFPLELGQLAQQHALSAFLGLVITAVILPFLGVWSMALHQGSWRSFFSKLGKFGFVVCSLCLFLLGPFGSTPRCVALSYATLNLYFPGLNVLVFNGIACTLVFLLAVRKNQIIRILGLFLTPALLAFLAFMFVRGWVMHAEEVHFAHRSKSAFMLGFFDDTGEVFLNVRVQAQLLGCLLWSNGQPLFSIGTP